MSGTSLPVIVGAAEAIQRPGDWQSPEDARGPIELMVEAARRAADDAGARDALPSLEWIGVAAGFWQHTNPGRVIAGELGCPDARAALGTMSGTDPQDLLAVACERIARGELRSALVLGGEARWSTKQLERRGEERPWNVDPGEGEPERVSVLPDGLVDEVRILGAPAAAYALMDDRLRHARGQSLDAQRSELAALWHGFSEVATRNPYAWDRSEHDADSIREASDDNRWIVFPYTKAMVANNTVDLASALLVCSRDEADALGVAEERRVYPHVVTHGEERPMLCRNELHETPALREAGRAAFEASGFSPEDFAHVDLYSCFPGMVRISSSELGIDPTRELTVTGGLGFAGAAVANAVGHSLAAMVARVRDAGPGFVHANGGNATKHACGVFHREAPARFQRLQCTDAAEHRERGALPEDWTGAATIEAACVPFGREGPSHVAVALLGGDRSQERGFGQSDDPELIAAAMESGLVGQPVVRDERGRVRLR